MKKIPVYTLQTISCKPSKIGHIELLRFEDHLKNIAGVHFPHRHDFYYLLYISSGKGTHTIDFKTYAFEAGQLYVMSPGQIHEWNIRSAMKGYVLFFSKETFYSDSMKVEEQWPFFHSHFNEPLYLIQKKQRQQIIQWFEWLLHEYENHSAHHSGIMKHLMCSFLYKLSDLIQTRPAKPGHENIVRQYELLLDTHYHEEHELSFYASQLNITPNYLNSLCKKETGKSSKTLLSERIMLETKRLLLHSTLSVTQISDHLSFQTASYFTRFFKKHEHMTPFEFRKSRLKIIEK